MADELKRPRGGDGRRGVSRRPKREAVPAGPWDDTSFDDDGDAGSAGVREPRRPKPPGPLSDAGALPMPEPPLVLTLPDPRR